MYHGTNLVYAFGKANNSEYDVFTQAYQDFYINFINKRDPGGKCSRPAPQAAPLV